MALVGSIGLVCPQGRTVTAVGLHVTCECLLQLMPVGGAFQQATQGYDDVLEARALAGIFLPALLYNHQADATIFMSKQGDTDKKGSLS